MENCVSSPLRGPGIGHSLTNSIASGIVTGIMTAKEKTRENRLRRKLERMGYRLHKSRRRDPDAWDYGLYAIVDVNTNAVMHQTIADTAFSLNLDEVAAWIEEQRRAQGASGNE